MNFSFTVTALYRCALWTWIVTAHTLRVRITLQLVSQPVSQSVPLGIERLWDL